MFIEHFDINFVASRLFLHIALHLLMGCNAFLLPSDTNAALIARTLFYLEYAQRVSLLSIFSEEKEQVDLLDVTRSAG